MSRAFRQQADERILDVAAGLFARHGFEHTSLRTVADAVGLSKAGLLHHYPSKEALHEAARQSCRTLGEQVVEQLAALPLGPGRDRRAVEVLTDLALDRPGLVALALGAVNGTDEDPGNGVGDVIVHEAFGVDRDFADPERTLRVVGALSAMAVLTLLANGAGQRSAWRPHIVATCLDALGHPRSQVED